MKTFSHRSLATVVAFWSRVGKTHENLVKLSVTTRMFSNPPFPLSKERKSLASSSIGSFAINDFMGALGGSGALRRNTPSATSYILLNVGFHEWAVEPRTNKVKGAISPRMANIIMKTLKCLIAKFSW